MKGLVVFPLCLVLQLGCSSERRNEEARLDRICKALDTVGNYDLPQPEAPHRLIQEIGRMAPTSPAARKALVKCAFGGDEIRRASAAALAATPGVDVEDVIAAFRVACKEGEEAEARENRLLICLEVFGHMGVKAAGAAPFLLEEMKRYRDTPYLQGAILLVLANVGHELPATTARLREVIAEMGKGGGGEVAAVGDGAVWILSRTGVGAWFDDGMKSDVVKRLKSTSFLKNRGEARRACSFALALMRLGDRARSARPEVTRLRLEAEAVAKMGEEAGPPAHVVPYSRIVFSICEWQMNPSDEAPLRQALRFLSDGAGLSGRPAVEDLAPLLTDRSVARMVGLLGDMDPQVVESAAEVCGTLGLRAYAARPEFLRVLEGALSQADGVNRAHLIYYATRGLSAVGSPEDIPRLRRLQGMADEESSRRIARAIEALTLLE